MGKLSGGKGQKKKEEKCREKVKDWKQVDVLGLGE